MPRPRTPCPTGLSAAAALAPGPVLALVFALVLALLLALGLGLAGASSATADEGTAPDTVPSEQQVRAARDAVALAAGDVASVQAALSAASERLDRAAIRVAKAEERYNLARYRTEQADRAARAAERRSRIAGADLARQREAYADAVTSSYQMAPGLTALAAIGSSDGIDTLQDRVATIDNAEKALDLRYDRFRATVALAGVADRQAEAAQQAARAAKREAEQARAAARAAAADAAAETRAIEAQRQALIVRLAELEDISVATAAARQRGLELAAAEEAAAAAQAAAEATAAATQTKPVRQPQPQPQPQPQHQPQPDPDDEDSGPTGGTVTPPPAPDPTPPPPSGGAQAAIAFARAQIGEPYVWGGAGPDRWDCSGLTMKAWAQGGKSLPHSSVAQYEVSTPITVGQLQPGDLVFWGDSRSPDSIYHVALYSGNGRIVHAPRTGEPVAEVSMYYWRAPDFFARP